MGLKNNLRANAFALFVGVAFCTSSFAASSVIAPDLPIQGWATQNGGTTGGAGKPVVTVSNVNDLRKYAEAGNYTIYVKPGTYTVKSKETIKVGSNVTIYGYKGAVLEQTHTDVTNEENTVLSLEGKNIIVRNITVKGSGAIDLDAGDCMHVKGGTNVWIDHVDVYDGQDGNMDVINGANYVTISWTKFHYTSASKNHQFSNLIGNSDNKTSDSGKLKTTIHHSWWGAGVKERMPRVRFGQVHVVNNLFNSDNSSTCVRTAKSADVRVENNIFIGVNNPIDLYDGNYTGVTSVGNYTENIKKGSASSGKSAAFIPPYNFKATDVSTQVLAYTLKDSIELYSGATLADPGTSEGISPIEPSAPISSSSSVKSSSSEAKSSSSIASSSSAKSSSSVAVSTAASLTKHGIGSTKQEVLQGASIEEFYYTIEGATGAIVSGLPDGVEGTLKGSDYYISGAVKNNALAREYKFTVTTVGAAQNVSKSGTITVIALQQESSSSEKIVAEPVSSSSEESVEEPKSPSSENTQYMQNFAVMNLKIAVQGRSLAIAYAKGERLHIFDMQGKIISQKNILSDNFVLALQKPGAYLVRIGNMSKIVNIK